MAVRKVPLAEIRPNPWQVRLEQDAAYIEELAASIALQGLMQTPGGRMGKSGKVELAYGMNRLAAFRLLAGGKGMEGIEYDKARYAAMPVDVRPRSDLEMFEEAVGENVKRQDLSPIERAQAMRRYMDEFGADREDAGNLFGLQASSVSNVLALLDLAPGVSALTHEGIIPERMARMFVHLSRLQPDRADRIAERIRETGESDPDEIASEIAAAMAAAGRMLMGPYDRGYVEGKWWKLGANLRRVDPSAALMARALAPIYPDGLVPGPDGGTSVGRAAKALWTELVPDGVTPRELVELKGWPAEAVERLARLVAPPACTACDMRSVVQGKHYCAFKECFQAKREAFRSREVQKAHKGLAWMPIYQKADGQAVAPDNLGYYNSEAKNQIRGKVKRAMERKSPDLRLRPRTPAFMREEDRRTGSAFAEVVAIGELGKELRDLDDAARKASGLGGGCQQADQKQLAALRLRAETNQRLRDEACRYVVGVFGQLQGVVLEVIGRLALGAPMPWTGDDRVDDDFDWRIQPGDSEDMAELPRIEPAEREGLIRAALAERVVAWTGYREAEPRDLAATIAGLGAPGGPLARLAEFPAGWADEILAGYDQGGKDGAEAGQATQPEADPGEDDEASEDEEEEADE